MALAIVADPAEWIVVSSRKTYKLESLSAVQDVRMVPDGGGRPPGLVGEIRAFARLPTAEERREWMEEGALLAEVELEFRARGAVTTPPTRTNVLPSAGSYAGGSWLNCEVNALYEAGGVVPVTSGFGHVVVSGVQCVGVFDGGGSFLLEWVALSDVDAQKAALIKCRISATTWTPGRRGARPIPS